MLHPLRIADGVVAGVADYGNKIGLPTVAGAVLYDPGYTANPLVFCGCIGSAPSPAAELTGPHPGDRVVVIGGRTGRDGIRGATFSSRTMDAATGEVAGASVQIGDPIVEKLLIDVLADASGLYTAITDCGAGGLSSAVGEMADDPRRRRRLALAPLKYDGLAPWEIWLSEAQERMVLAVAPDTVQALRGVCLRHGVELTDLGRFTGDGRLLVRHGDDVLVDLDVAFLHDGRPQRTMTAEWPSPPREHVHVERPLDTAATLLALLAHPNIASNQDVVHRYDHEIRGATVVRPLIGVAGDGPADGVVLAEPEHDARLRHRHRRQPVVRRDRPGADGPRRRRRGDPQRRRRRRRPRPGRAPRQLLVGRPAPATTLGELVAAVLGCCDAAIAYGAPFVSGKDSLNNEFTGADGLRHAVPPTLVITAVAHVPDAVAGGHARPEAVAGDRLSARRRTALPSAAAATSTCSLRRGRATPVPAPDPDALGRYRRLHRVLSSGLVRSCHDVSEGGLAVAARRDGHRRPTRGSCRRGRRRLRRSSASPTAGSWSRSPPTTCAAVVAAIGR